LRSAQSTTALPTFPLKDKAIDRYVADGLYESRAWRRAMDRVFRGSI
jgi:hypothetical protein